METPQWGLFAGAVLVATAALLVLSRSSARALSAARGPGTGPPAGPEGAASPEVGPSTPAFPTGAALLVNLVLTHGLFGTLVLTFAWYARIPPAALGVGDVTPATVAAGAGLGLGIYLASEAASRAAGLAGFAPDERLRSVLAPDRPRDWAILLVVTLPTVAVAEELLFRAALIGAMAAGFGLPAWGLAVASSALFALGHGAQGTLGVAVTGALGFVLAGAFVLTGSLAVVVVAHYTVDAAEFVVHEWALA